MQKKLVQFQMPITDVEIRADENAIVIQWVASTPEIDRYNSIVTVDWIRNGMSNYIANPVILLWHDSDKAIGTMVEHRVDNTGLFIKAKLTLDVDNIYQAIKNGVTRGFSIGFYPIEYSYENKEWVPLSALSQEDLDKLDYNDVVRKITKIDLVEISVVNTPANPSALFTMQKAVRAFFEWIEKRSVIELQKRDIEEEATEEVMATETTEETPKDEVEETTEEEIQGDEVETAGENPEPPTEEDDNPEPAVEITADEEPTTDNVVEDPQAESGSEEMRKVLDLFDQAMWIIELQNGKIEKLEAIVSKIPAKRWFVTVAPNKPSEDPLLSEMRNAKQKALGNV